MFIEPIHYLLKHINLAVCYGGEPMAVARRMGLSEREANAVVEQWRERYPQAAKTLAGE